MIRYVTLSLLCLLPVLLAADWPVSRGDPAMTGVGQTEKTTLAVNLAVR